MVVIMSYRHVDDLTGRVYTEAEMMADLEEGGDLEWQAPPLPLIKVRRRLGPDGDVFAGHPGRITVQDDLLDPGVVDEEWTDRFRVEGENGGVEERNTEVEALEEGYYRLAGFRPRPDEERPREATPLGPTWTPCPSCQRPQCWLGRGPFNMKRDGVFPALYIPKESTT